MASFNDLTPEAQERFSLANKRLGLAPDTCTHGPLAMEKGKPFVFSSDPLESDVPPHLISVGSIQQLKEMVGSADGWANREEFEFPEQPDVELQAKFQQAKSLKDLKQSLTQKERSLLQKMATIYVVVNAEWAQPYLPLINTLFFPRQVAYFSSLDDFQVTGPVLITGQDHVFWNYNKVSILPGGSINAQTKFTLNCETFDTSQASSSKEYVEAGTNYQLGAIPANYPTPATNGTDVNGTQAGAGRAGDNGVAAYNSSNCSWYCVTPPSNGQQGAKGADGGTGSAGNQGLDQSPVTATIGTITGNLIINCGGGNGQTGGNGGHGQDGGQGGPPGNQDATKACQTANYGPLGPGGNGGKGGDAGPGGDGAVLSLTYKQVDGQIQYFQTGGQPGNPGQGGLPGNGYPPGKTLGNGNNASAGKPSQVYLNGQLTPPS